MMGLWGRRVLRVLVPPAVIFCSGCTATTDATHAPVAAPVRYAADVGPGSPGSARFYAIGEALVHEQARNATLRSQLEERGKELARLQAEVEELRGRESQLRTELERATGAPAAAAPSDDSGHGLAGGTGATGQDTPPAPKATAGTPADSTAQAAVVANLQASLAQEQQRRQQVEIELSHLKEETSRPPYGGTDAELTAARQEIVQLRTTLDDERAARQRLLQQFRALEQRAAQQSAAQPPAAKPPATDHVGLSAPESAATAELQARLERLQAEQKARLESFNRALAASQQRAAELEQQLAAAQADKPAATDQAAAPELESIRTENATLRARLEEEHRRTADLTAKLKMATRVTDLIFKMQGQQAQPRPPHAP